MGEPVRIAEMARDLVWLSGLEPGRDIEIVYTGLRPGEKLAEELWTGTEDLDATAQDKLLVIRRPEAEAASLERLLAQMESLERLAKAGGGESSGSQAGRDDRRERVPSPTRLPGSGPSMSPRSTDHTGSDLGECARRLPRIRLAEDVGAGALLSRPPRAPAPHLARPLGRPLPSPARRACHPARRRPRRAGMRRT